MIVSLNYLINNRIRYGEDGIDMEEEKKEETAEKEKATVKNDASKEKSDGDKSTKKV